MVKYNSKERQTTATDKNSYQTLQYICNDNLETCHVSNWIADIYGDVKVQRCLRIP